MRSHSNLAQSFLAHSFLPLAAALWLMAGHPASADEMDASNGKAAGVQTNATNGTPADTDDSMGDNRTVMPRIQGGSNVEWRRHDHPADSHSQGAGRSGGSDSSGGSDGGGGGSSSSD